MHSKAPKAKQPKSFKRKKHKKQQKATTWLDDWVTKAFRLPVSGLENITVKLYFKAFRVYFWWSDRSQSELISHQVCFKLRKLLISQVETSFLKDKRV